jgi:hypothetical protein
VDVQNAVFSPDVCNPQPVMIKPRFSQKVRTGIVWALVGGAVALYAEHRVTSR